MFAAAIGCQADKTAEAVSAFIGLIDDLPRSPKRFAEAQEAQINAMRTARLGFCQLLGAVRMWELQGLTVDPRAWRYAQIQQAARRTWSSSTAATSKAAPS